MKPISTTYNIRVEFIRNNAVQHTVTYSLLSPHKMTKKKIRDIFTGVIIDYLDLMTDMVLTTRCKFSINNQHFRLAVRKNYKTRNFNPKSLEKNPAYKSDKIYYDYSFAKERRRNIIKFS